MYGVRFRQGKKTPYNWSRSHSGRCWIQTFDLRSVPYRNRCLSCSAMVNKLQTYSYALILSSVNMAHARDSLIWFDNMTWWYSVSSRLRSLSYVIMWFLAWSGAFTSSIYYVYYVSVLVPCLHSVVSWQYWELVSFDLNFDWELPVFWFGLHWRGVFVHSVVSYK